MDLDRRRWPGRGKLADLRSSLPMAGPALTLHGREVAGSQKHVTASRVSCFSVAPGDVSKARLGRHDHNYIHTFFHKMHSLIISTIATVRDSRKKSVSFYLLFDNPIFPPPLLAGAPFQVELRSLAKHYTAAFVAVASVALPS